MQVNEWNFIIGICIVVIGSLLWMQQEPTSILNVHVFVSVALILLGAINILLGIEPVMTFLSRYKNQAALLPKAPVASLLTKAIIIAFIFIGSVSYTIASYYHLKHSAQWTFLKALMIAVPFVFIEYQFSLRGNFLARSVLGMNAVQITILTIIFYFVNAWVLNYFVLKHKVVPWREILAFICIIIAFLLTGVIH